MANFSYLVDNHNMLSNPYGSSNRERADALQAVKSLNDVIALEKTAGWNSYNAERSDSYREFITRFVTNKNTDSSNISFNWLQPPRQFWSYGRGNVYASQEPIRTLIVKEVTTLFDGKSLSEIRNIEVLRITIPIKEI